MHRDFRVYGKKQRDAIVAPRVLEYNQQAVDVSWDSQNATIRSMCTIKDEKSGKQSDKVDGWKGTTANSISLMSDFCWIHSISTRWKMKKFRKQPRKRICKHYGRIMRKILHKLIVNLLKWWGWHWWEEIEDYNEDGDYEKKT